MIQSHDGVLNATLIAPLGAITVDGHLALNAATYDGLYPGPTLQFNPGDQVNIDLVKLTALKEEVANKGLPRIPVAILGACRTGVVTNDHNVYS